MKQLFILALLFMCLSSFGQALSRGYYKSRVYTEDRKFYLDMEFYYSSGRVHLVNFEKRGSVMKTVNTDNMTIATYSSCGDTSTEGFTFTFSRGSKAGDIYLHILKVVQRPCETPWMLYMAGNVEKTH